MSGIENRSWEGGEKGDNRILITYVILIAF
jgi:hypothetical protein